MKRRDPQSELQKDVVRRQRNTVWPDTLRNSFDVDWFLWHGSPKSSAVQRFAAAIFGSSLIAFSAMFLTIALRDNSEFILLFAMGWLLVGWKVFANALSNKQKDFLLRPLAVVFGFSYVAAFLAWPLIRR